MELTDLWKQHTAILDKIDILNAENGLLPGMQILHVSLKLERFMSLPKEYWQLELMRIETEAEIVLQNFELEKVAPEGRIVFGEPLLVALQRLEKECKIIDSIFPK